MTRLERYLEAIEFTEKALEAFDDAESCMRDALIEMQARGFRRPNQRELLSDLESFLDELRALTCDECGKPVTHTPPLFPDPRLAIDIDETATVELAGLCGCEWLYEDAPVKKARQ